MKKHLLIVLALIATAANAEDASVEPVEQALPSSRNYDISVHGDSNDSNNLLRAPVTFADEKKPLKQLTIGSPGAGPLSGLNSGGGKVNKKPLLVNLPAAKPQQSAKPEKQGDWFNFVEVLLNVDDVKPWQKGTLAKTDLKPGGDVPVFDKVAQKVFLSKESTRGGYGVAGGGCGCN